MLNRSRLLIIAFFCLALVTSLTLPTLAAQDMIFTYSDAAYTLPETTFDDGETVYVMITDNVTTLTGALTIFVTNDQEGNLIAVSVTEGATPKKYEGSFINPLWSRWGRDIAHGTRPNGNYYRRLR